MYEALAEATKGIYTTKPNPAVGCVIVKEGQIISRGYHQVFGEDHAEIDALKKIDFQGQNCDMYVTLEPCAHFGKTPPCVDAIIAAGIKRVIIPFADPNPKVTEKSIQKLKAAGIDVIQNILTQPCHNINRFFLHYMKTKRPFVIAKWAMTNDGQLSIPHARWISHEKSRAHAHLLRQRADAILIGAETLRKDNPALTTRLTTIPPDKIKHPKRVILTSSGNIPLDANLFWDEHSKNTMVVCKEQPIPSLQQLCLERNISLFVMTGNSQKEQLDYLLDHLGYLGVMSLIVEGGAKTLKAFLELALVHEMQCYIAKFPIITDVTSEIMTSIKKFTNHHDYHIEENFMIADDMFVRLSKESNHV